MTYGQLVLSKSWRNVQILWDHDMTEVLFETDAPQGQPINVMDSQVARQLNFDVFALISS